MAIHAGLGGRNVGETRSLDRGVAIAAIHAQTADVMRVAERHGLFPRLRGARRVVGPVNRSTSHARKPSMNTAPKIVIRANVFVL